MDNSSTLFTPIQSVNFLPLIYCLNVLGDVFYSEQLLTKANKRKPFLIINTLYEHLDKTKNETEAKQQLVQKLLNGTDLYGGNKDEILDMDYVDKTLDHIVSGVVFLQWNNLYGYLGSVVSTSTNLKLSDFKKTLIRDLSYLRHLDDDDEVSSLTELSITRIVEALIWPLFPERKHDITIISVEYLYALAGLKLAQTAQMNLTDMNFHRYVTLGMTTEVTAISKELPESVLQIFALPAIIYYAYKEREKFNQRKVKIFINNEDFWSDAFFTLFTYLYSTFETIRQEALASNSLYQFHLEMSKFKNRTVVARETLHKECSYLNDTYLESLIEDYKTYSSSTRCHRHAKLLPNLELVYEAQFHSIKEKYRLMELDFIRSAFDDLPLLKTLINSTGTIVYKASPKPNDMYCYLCPPTMPTFNPNIILFGVKGENQTVFFALEHNENNVTLILHRGEKIEFNTRIGLGENVEVEVPLVRTRIKQPEESFDFFVEKIAEMKAEEFRKQLFGYGYDTTSMEKFFEILKAFIPFYHCIQYARAGEQGMAALTCIGDVVGLIPFVGVFNIGFKMSTMTINRFLLTAELSLRSYTLRQAILTTMTVGLRNTALELSGIFSKVIFTKQMFKAVSVGVIRTLDPGFELVGKLTTRGSVLIGKVMNKAFKQVSKKFPSLNFKYAKFENILLHLTGQSAKSADIKIVSVPGIERKEIEGREVFRFIYPGGKEPFGPKYIQLSKGYAELRHLNGFEKEIPVVITKVSKRGRIFFKRINLETEELFGLELKLNKHGKLENAKQPFRQHIYKIKTEGLGGRGAIMVRREKSITDAVKLVVDAKIGVNRYNAEKTMRHYVLESNIPSNIDDLVDVEIDFGKLNDLEIQNFVTEHVSGIDELPMIDPNLNKYLPVPTYYDFALDWIRTKQISQVYSEFYVKNPDGLEKILYNSRIVVNPNFHTLEARNKISGLYNLKNDQVHQVDLQTALNIYSSTNIFEHSTFEDYYALLIWQHNGFTNIMNPFLATQIKNSLYRLAIRQSNNDLRKKKLFQLEIRRPLEFERDPSQLVDKILIFFKIQLSMSEIEMYKELLAYQPREPVQIFLYEVKIDSSYLAVDLEDIISIKDAAVLLPDMPYVIQSAKRTVIMGFDIIYVIMQNEPIAKETVIAKLMNEIDTPRANFVG
ncbi:uncharacterized protein LOC122500919 [Leptopilina heterotoma]|uniref:uncharacterized protein LOC122500919 n=1 Tax=Leptopilina heterotoma TaxID=63436 RepID=UPI001CAA0975|nr:uncharacterized protein LOC122500919 [Leptopilina heterotoma]